MDREKYLILLKSFILLSPLPFGCVGKIFSPLFYMLLLTLSFIGINYADKPVKIKLNRTKFIYEKRAIKIFYILLGFLLFQSIPLPVSFLKIISPGSIKALTELKDTLPFFYTISQVPVETIIFTLQIIVMAAFFWSFVNIKLKKFEMFSIINTLILSASLQSFFGLIKYSTGSEYFFLFFHKIKIYPESPFLTGTLGNPDHFAFYLEMIIPLILANIFLKIKFLDAGSHFKDKMISAFNQERNFIIYFVLLVLAAVAIILTGARSGILTLVLSFLIFSLLSYYLKKTRMIRKKLKVIFIVIAVAAVFIGIQNTTEKFMTTSFESSGRFLRWPNSMNMAYDFPIFGTGFGTYKYSFFCYDTDPGGKWSTHAHNEYIETLTDGGIVGTIILLSLFGILIASIFKMWISRKHPEIKIMGIGILTGIFAVSIHSFFDFSLRIPSNLFVFILLLALGIQLATYKREVTEDSIKREKF
ncbi:MAG: O-antigen ligase family protein [Acidobacteriota bacterium]